MPQRMVLTFVTFCCRYSLDRSLRTFYVKLGSEATARPSAQNHGANRWIGLQKVQ